MSSNCSKALIVIALATAAATPAASFAAGNGRLVYAAPVGAIHSVAPDGTGAASVRGGLFPSVSPDGARLAYVDQLAETGPLGVWTSNLDGSGTVELATLPAAATGGLAWSRDGTRIALVSGDNVVGWNLLVVNTDGSAASVVAQGVSPVAPPSWAPDGSSIAYTTGNEVDIAIAKADGSGSTFPIRDAARDVAPSWSPDGSRIAFFRDTATGLVLYTMHPDGSSLEQLGHARVADPNEGALTPPSWSPDGSRIVFGSSVVAGWARYSSFYRREVYSVGADGTGERRLTDSAALDAGEAPIWSPDGARIAFVSDRAGKSQLYDMNADGSCETQLTTSVDAVSTETWQPLASGSLGPELECAAITVSGSIDVDTSRASLDEHRIYVLTGTIANNGNRDSGPVSFEVTGDNETAFVDASSAGGSCSTAIDKITCSLQPLTRDASTTFEVHFREPFTGWHSVAASAEATSGPPDGDQSDNVARPSRYFPFCETAESNGTTIRAGGADDLICGTVGPDKIFSGAGEDHVYGGGGHDTIHGQDDRDWLYGGGGVDYIYGDGGDDRIHGEYGNDVLFGGPGSDRIYGDQGGDYINGGPGVDYVYAGYGNDVIDVRDGTEDHVYCGPGVDTVRADLRDAVSGDCEHVSRGKPRSA